MVDSSEKTYLDFNRSGIPLLEIVGKPEISSPDEAVEFLQLFRTILKYLEICDGNMEEGSLRCDANLSVRKKGSQELGVKTEIKNLNSFSFIQKALEYDSHDSVNIDDFRYPGPRPQSKETALIMLADSAEAAVRSLKEPTAPRIRAIVGKIIETRMNDGELDHSGLTLNDIAIIREKYIQLLTGIFHPRISYPKQEEDEKEKGPERETFVKQPSQGERKGRV